MSNSTPSRPDPSGQTATKDDTMVKQLTEGHAPDTTETPLRFAAYTARVRTILLTAHRYVAYTSDIGESFRPVAHPNLVRGAYGISWLYLTGDVANEGYKAWVANQEKLGKKQSASVGSANIAPGSENTGKVLFLEDYRTVMVQRALFQGLASMGLPAFTIHSIVKYSGKALKGAKNQIVRTWAPIGLGLAIVPALPYMFDEPVEHGVEWIFEKGAEAFGGQKAHHSKEKEL